MTRRTRGYIGGALVGLLVFVLCPLTQAAAAVDDEKNNNRPRIGLVLGGGGANGRLTDHFLLDFFVCCANAGGICLRNFRSPV
jgi:hypothetical protein